MPRQKWRNRSCRRLSNIWIRTETLKSEGVRDCEKVKEKLDKKYRRGLNFADFYDMIARFASYASVGKNNLKLHCVFFF